MRCPARRRNDLRLSRVASRAVAVPSSINEVNSERGFVYSTESVLPMCHPIRRAGYQDRWPSTAKVCTTLPSLSYMCFHMSKAIFIQRGDCSLCRQTITLFFDLSLIKADERAFDECSCSLPGAALISGGGLLNGHSFGVERKVSSLRWLG
jgi:hypothetical protein